MARHNELGKWGEQIAADYLIANGYKIAGSNMIVGNVELDLIAMKDGGIMFVEVKTRTTDISDPLDAITPAKMRRLCRAADRYIRQNDLPHRPQFDIITIVGTPDSYTLQHFPDAFFPPLLTLR